MEVFEILPAFGPTFGRNLVRIIGTGFRPAPEPTATGAAPQATPVPTIRVRFAGEDALRADAVHEDLLFVLVPPYRGAAAVEPIPAVAVEVANLDGNGAAIPTETVVFPAAYTYQRVGLRAPSDLPDPHWRLVTREVLRFLRRNILPNVARLTHFDYAESGATVTFNAKLPSLVVEGPTVTRSSAPYQDNRFVDTVLSDGTIARYPPVLTVDLEFGLRGYSDNDRELLAMAAAVGELFARTPRLSVDTSDGRQAYLLTMRGYPDVGGGSPAIGVREFAATFVVEAVPTMAALPEGVLEVVDAITVGVNAYAAPAESVAEAVEIAVEEGS